MGIMGLDYICIWWIEFWIEYGIQFEKWNSIVVIRNVYGVDIQENQ